MFNNLPKDVLARMSPDEVTWMVTGLREEAQKLEDWNAKRGHWSEPEPRWPVVPPPLSANDYGKVRVR